MYKKYISVLLLGMLSLLISGFTFTVVASAQQIEYSEYNIVKDFHQFSGIDLTLKLEGNNLSNDGHATNQTSSLRLSNDSVLNDDFLLEENSIVIGRWEFNEDNQSTLLLEKRLKPGLIYQIVQNHNGDKTSVGYFTAKKGELTNLSPVIIASSRTVEMNDPTFNIMDGVLAYDGDGNDITSKVTYKGEVDLSKSGVYPIVYTVTANNGLSAIQNVNVTVETGASSLTPPVLDPVTATDATITGTASYSVGAKVYVILGTNQDTYRADLKKNGNFVIPLDHTYPKGTSITAYVADAQGNKSSEVYAVVQEGAVLVGVNRIESSSTIITGYTSPGADIEVDVTNNLTHNHLYFGVADSEGKYRIDMKGQSYPSGTKIVVTATLNGVSGSETVIVYPKKVSIDTVNIGSNVISGKADPDAMVHLTVNSKEYKFKADAAGSFYGILEVALESNDKITAYQISKNIESEKTTFILN